MDQITQGITTGILSIWITSSIIFIVKRFPRDLRTVAMLQFLVIMDIVFFIISMQSLAQPFMTWLLTNELFVLLMLSPVWFTIFIEFYAFFRPNSHIFCPRNVIEAKKFNLLVIICFLLSAGIGFAFYNVSSVYESDHAWRTIYTNNIDSNVSLSIGKSSLFSETVSIDSELMIDASKFKHENRGRLSLIKNGVTETRKIHFDPQNVDGTLNEHSKITKIEYRPVTQMYNTLFGFEGEYKQPNVDGEIRITFNQDDTHAELKNLFGD